jgi:hypothetical protein
MRAFTRMYQLVKNALKCVKIQGKSKKMQKNIQKMENIAENRFQPRDVLKLA